jgi:4-amino-4-deoxy-L-arabinose transferase-like glycosyltransferase
MGWRFSTLLLPPHGEHIWRDADGLGVARGFLHEGFHILFPRVVERGAGSGFVGMEFPLVNWLGAVSMWLLGESDGAARLPVWLCVPLLALGMRALSRRILVTERAAYVASVFVVLQPMVLIFSHKQMPEVPMITLLCWGLVLSFDGLTAAKSSRAWASAVAAACLLGLAAILKPTGVSVAVPIGVWFVQGLRKREVERWDLVARMSLIAGLPVAAVVVWFRHSQSLDLMGGNPLFHLHQDFWEWTRLILTWPFLSVVFGRCIHLILLWPTVALMAWRWRTLGRVLRENAMLGFWYLAGLAFVVSLGSHYFHHNYYALPLILPTSALVGAFVAAATSETGWPDGYATLFLAITAVTSLIRTHPLMPALTFNAEQVSRALPLLGPPGLIVATDQATPVASLVILRRNGWAVTPRELSPQRLEHFRRQGATLLVESSFGGWLPEETRAALPPPCYSDDQLRAYPLRP